MLISRDYMLKTDMILFLETYSSQLQSWMQLALSFTVWVQRDIHVKSESTPVTSSVRDVKFPCR